jgi:hypothetical protein
MEIYGQLLNIMSSYADMKKVYNDLIIINLYLSSEAKPCTFICHV